MGFWRIDTALTTNDQRWPRLLPEVVEFHRRFQGGNGMRRVARQGPGARLRIKIGEQAPLGIRARGTRRYSRGLIGRRTIDNLCDALTGEQREGVHKDESSDTVTRQLSRLADDHATGTGSYQYYLLQIFVKQQLCHFLRLRRDSDARPHQVMAFAAAVERRGVDGVPGGAQAHRHWLPYPATLIRPMNQNIGCHCRSFSHPSTGKWRTGRAAARSSRGPPRVRAE